MEKVILITGTRKGIGYELATYYLQKGNKVIGCSRGLSSLEHPQYLHYSLDVSDEVAVVKMVREVHQIYGKIDILLNNAGIASMNHILMTPLKTIKNILDTNFIGTFLFLREVSKVMVKNKKGRIINFGSIATPLRLEGEAAYAASKAAIVNLTEISAKELAQFNITVNAIGSTPIPTDLIKNVPKNKMNALLSQQALKRFATIQDITNVIDFFIQDHSDFVTGQIIYLGGVHS